MCNANSLKYTDCKGKGRGHCITLLDKTIRVLLEDPLNYKDYKSRVRTIIASLQILLPIQQTFILALFPLYRSTDRLVNLTLILRFNRIRII
jgi:hypothetical protein